MRHCGGVVGEFQVDVFEENDQGQKCHIESDA